MERFAEPVKGDCMPGSSPEDTQVSDAIDSSTVIDAQAPDSGSNDQGGDTAASPPAAAVTMLDAVQSAMEPKEASPASQEPGPDANADPDAKAAEGEETDELSADELKALNWKTQQRFKKAYSTVKAKDGEIAELKPKAVEYDRMVGAIQRAGVAPAELDELVELGGMLKSNPRGAYEKMIPILRALEGVIGEVLPPDLQEQVRLGYITEQHARDLNRSKANERHLTQRAEQDAAGKKAAQEADAFTKLTTESISAVERWDAQQASKDPDWHLKQREVAEQVELAITRESNKRRAPYFPTSDEAVKLAKDALKTVEDRMKRFAPKPTEIRAATPGSSTRSKPAPKTILDAVNNAMG